MSIPYSFRQTFYLSKKDILLTLMCLSDDPVISRIESFFFPSIDNRHVIGLEWASKYANFIHSYKKKKKNKI